MLVDMRLHRAHLSLTGKLPVPESIAEAARQAGFSRTDKFNAAYRQRYGRKPQLPSGPARRRSPPGSALVNGTSDEHA
jgi:AraC-like DNA-binding protein